MRTIRCETKYCFVLTKAQHDEIHNYVMSRWKQMVLVNGGFHAMAKRMHRNKLQQIRRAKVKAPSQT